MINYEYLTEKERTCIKQAISHSLIDIKIYTLDYYGDENNDRLKICAYIQILLSGNISIIVSTGEHADDLIILNEVDFKIKREDHLLQGGVELIVTTMQSAPIIKTIEGKILNKVKCLEKPDEEYYWQMEFCFEGSTLLINSLIDEVSFVVLQNLSEN